MKIPLYYIIFFLTKRTSLVPTHCFVQQITKTIFVYNLSCATTARNTYVLPLSTKGNDQTELLRLKIYIHLTVLTCTMETCRIVVDIHDCWIDIVVRTKSDPKRSDPVSSSGSEEDPNIITAMGMPPPKTEVPPHVLEKFLSSFGRQRKRKAGSDAVEEENEERCSSGRKKKKKESNHAPH